MMPDLPRSHPGIDADQQQADGQADAVSQQLTRANLQFTKEHCDAAASHPFSLCKL
jgi:hypothetical protein